MHGMPASLMIAPSFSFSTAIIIAMSASPVSLSSRCSSMVFRSIVGDIRRSMRRAVRSFSQKKFFTPSATAMFAGGISSVPPESPNHTGRR